MSHTPEPNGLTEAEREHLLTQAQGLRNSSERIGITLAAVMQGAGLVILLIAALTSGSQFLTILQAVIGTVAIAGGFFTFLAILKVVPAHVARAGNLAIAFSLFAAAVIGAIYLFTTPTT